MIKIVRTEDNQWGIFAPAAGVVMEPAEFGEMLEQAKALGIAASELDMGFTELYAQLAKDTGHNVIEYGIGLTPGGPKFMYTTKATIVTAPSTKPKLDVVEGNGLILRGFA